MNEAIRAREEGDAEKKNTGRKEARRNKEEENMVDIDGRIEIKEEKKYGRKNEKGRKEGWKHSKESEYFHQFQLSRILVLFLLTSVIEVRPICSS